MTTERERQKALIEQPWNRDLEVTALVKSLHESEDRLRAENAALLLRLGAGKDIVQQMCAHLDGFLPMDTDGMDGWNERAAAFLNDEAEPVCEHCGTPVRELIPGHKCWFDAPAPAVEEQLSEGMVVEDTPGCGSTPRHTRVAESGSSPGPSDHAVQEQLPSGDLCHIHELPADANGDCVACRLLVRDLRRLTNQPVSGGWPNCGCEHPSYCQHRPGDM